MSTPTVTITMGEFVISGNSATAEDYQAAGGEITDGDWAYLKVTEINGEAMSGVLCYPSEAVEREAVSPPLALGGAIGTIHINLVNLSNVRLTSLNLPTSNVGPINLSNLQFLNGRLSFIPISASVGHINPSTVNPSGAVGHIDISTVNLPTNKFGPPLGSSQLGDSEEAPADKSEPSTLSD